MFAIRMCWLVVYVFSLWLPIKVFGQSTLPTGWTETATRNGTRYDFGTNDASIVVTQGPRANLQNVPGILRSADKPEFCNGISRTNPISIKQTRGQKYESFGPQTNCAILVSETDAGSVFVIAMERVGSKSNALALAQSLFLRTFGLNADSAGRNSEASNSANSNVNASAPVKPSLPDTRATAPVPNLLGSNLPLAKASDPVGLIGMWRSDWMEHEFNAFNGLQLVAKSYTLIFTKGGYFFYGVPDSVGLDDDGAQIMMRTDPHNVGRYKVVGKTIQLNFAKGEMETVEAQSRNNVWDLTFRNRIMSPKMTFVTGGGLSGTYSSERISQAGTTFVVGNSDYNFSLDGRFAKGGKVSMTSAPVSSIGKRNVKTGRYEIKASALYLYYDDGTRETYSIFQETAGGNIWLNERMYSHSESR